MLGRMTSSVDHSLLTLADEGLLDDCVGAGTGAAGAEEELSTGGALLGTGLVALLEVLTVDGAGVEGVRPGTGFSLTLLTFCCWPFSLPTFGSFRTMGVGVSVRSSSKEMVSGRQRGYQMISLQTSSMLKILRSSRTSRM